MIVDHLVCVFGIVGMGKSTTLQAIVLENLDHWADLYVVVLDQTREWHPLHYGARLTILDPRDGWTAQSAAAWCIDSWAPCLLVIDECETWIPNNPGGLPQGSPLWRVVMTGRHDQVGLCLGAHRPQDVHTALLSQASAIFCHQLETEQDLAALRRAGWPDALVNTVPTLAPGHRVHRRRRPPPA